MVEAVGHRGGLTQWIGCGSPAGSAGASGFLGDAQSQTSHGVVMAPPQSAHGNTVGMLWGCEQPLLTADMSTLQRRGGRRDEATMACGGLLCRGAG